MQRLTWLLFFLILVACAPTSMGETAVPSPTPIPTKTALPPIPSLTETAVITPVPSPTETAVYPATTPFPSPTPPPPPQASVPAEAAPICPDVPRPALLYANEYTNEAQASYTIAHPQTAQACQLTLPIQNSAVVHTNNDALYLLLWDHTSDTPLLRYAADGTLTPISLPTQDIWTSLPDETGKHVAWNEMTRSETTEVITNTLYLTDISTQQTTTLVSVNNQPEVDSGAPYMAWTVNPVMFLEDSLLYTIAPNGKGGSWNAYTGQYSNLFAIPLTGGQPEGIYHCPADDYSDCIGDIDPVRRWLVITDRDRQTISIIDFDGNLIHAFKGKGKDYIGAPHVSSEGKVVFLSADMGEDRITIEQSYIEVVDVIAKTPPTVLQQTPTTYVWGWLDANHVLYWPVDGPNQLSDLAGNVTMVNPDLARTIWLLGD